MTPLYQWERGRKISMSVSAHTTINRVEFSQTGHKESLLVKPREENGAMVADVPDILLQSGDYIRVYLSYMDEDLMETTAHRTLTVIKRPKPTDYVYTETEVKTWEDLDARIKEIEENGKPNWNANEGETGHVQNRTHWTEYNASVEVLPENALVFADNSIRINHPFALTVEKSYTVNWKGVAYNCVAQEYTIDDLVFIALGDVGAFDGKVDTGEPFCIARVPDEIVAEEGFWGMVLPMDGSSYPDVTLSIYCGGEVVHKLDNKYLDLDWLPVVMENVLVPEFTAVISAANSFVEIADSQDALSALRLGQNVIVDINGTRYQATVGGNLDGYCIAEYGYVSDMTTSGSIPSFSKNYAIHWYKKNYAAFIASEPSTYTVRVVAEGGNTNKIPKEFLPNGFDGNVVLTGYATEQFVRDGYQPKGDYLESTDLAEAVNTALAEAKASGEFDGADGKDGKDGQDGYTPVKGVDYFDGKDGADGQPGKDGQDYVLTDADKTEIAEMASVLVDVPSGGGGSENLELLFKVVTTEEVRTILSGVNPADYKEILMVCTTMPVVTTASTHFDWLFTTTPLRISSSLHNTQKRVHVFHAKKHNEDDGIWEISFGHGLKLKGGTNVETIDEMTHTVISVTSCYSKVFVFNDQLATDIGCEAYIYGNTDLVVGSELRVYGR